MVLFLVSIINNPASIMTVAWIDIKLMASLSYFFVRNRPAKLVMKRRIKKVILLEKKIM
jgi:hypothetical protein